MMATKSGRFIMLLLFLLTVTVFAAPVNGCSNNGDCSGAGICTDGACVCEAAFTGESCARINNMTIPINNGFTMEKYWVWGSHIVYVPNEDAARPYQMVASVYPNDESFGNHWLYDSQIVRASATNVTGPYQFEEFILPYTTNESAWDRSCDNPKIVFSPADNKWAVFYTGSHFNGSRPVPTSQYWNVQSSQRVGVALSDKLINGTWERLDHPIIPTSPSPSWDDRITDNPTVTVYKNKLYMIYKASTNAKPGPQGGVCMGYAISSSAKGPWVKGGDPIISCPANTFYGEDPTVWYDPETDYLHLVAKDFDGHFTHEGYSGMHWFSKDGKSWNVTDPALAYLPVGLWSDGIVRHLKSQERAQVVQDDKGRVIAFSYATNTGLDGKPAYWSIVIPVPVS